MTKNLSYFSVPGIQAGLGRPRSPHISETQRGDLMAPGTQEVSTSILCSADSLYIPVVTPRTPAPHSICLPPAARPSPH